jgi:hypothetical protein
VSAQPITAAEEEHGDTFDLTIRADNTLTKDETAYTLTILIKAFRGERQVGTFQKVVVLSPLSSFKDEAQAREWADQTFRSLRARSTGHLLHEAALLVSDVANEATNTLGIEPVDMQNTIQGHVRRTAEHLHQQFNIKRTGPALQWGGSELSFAVSKALKALPKSQQTYSGVVEMLKRSHDDKAPKTAEALRKMMSRFGLNWKEIKSGRVSMIEETYKRM